MIQHVALVESRPGVPEAVRHERARQLRTLRDVVPGLRTWRVGLNATTMDRAWDLSITGEFDTVTEAVGIDVDPDAS